MTPPYPNPHSPEERRKLSNVGHWAEGAVLTGAGGLALLDALRPELRWPGRWWPWLATGAGVGLGGLILGGSLHHGGPVRYLRHEHQDRQHLQMAGLIAAGGLLEAVGDATPARLAWPAALAAVGALFLSHEQRGTGEAQAAARRAHVRLGWSIVAAGGAKAAEVLRVPGPWRLAWPLIALTVGAQLLAYREPGGAYEDGHA